MVFSHQNLTIEPPQINLGDVPLDPQPSFKWLGVILDPKLTFTAQVKTQASEGAKITNHLLLLARTGWGIPLPLCKRLTSSLINTRTDYACAVRHKYKGTATGVASIQRVDNAAHGFAPGTFKTHPLPFPLHHTNSLSTRDHLDYKTDAALARLLTLPPSNPAGRLNPAALATSR